MQCTQTHRIVCFKWVSCMESELHLTTLFKKNDDSISFVCGSPFWGGMSGCCSFARPVLTRAAGRLGLGITCSVGHFLWLLVDADWGTWLGPGWDTYNPWPLGFLRVW